MKEDLINKKCKPCEGGISPFDMDTIRVYLLDTPGWSFDDGSKEINREFKFKNFVESIKFINLVADLSETEGHHPDIFINFNKVILKLKTHAIGGLSENDFILAVKINRIYKDFSNE